MSKNEKPDPSRISRLDPSVEPGVWRYAKASRASVIIDAADYFAFMQEAMLGSRRRILLIGWDFDTRIHLERGRRWWQGALRVAPRHRSLTQCHVRCRRRCSCTWSR